MKLEHIKDDKEPFLEIQCFNQLWLWAIQLGVSVPLVGVFTYGMWQQLVRGLPWGDRPMSDSALVLTSTLLIVSLLSVMWLLRTMQLTVEEQDDGLSIHFPPFVRRKIPWNGIQSFEVRTYHPLREYGGWGIRYGGSGKAYNVAGNRGVQLHLKSGERLLIGSQRPDELVQAMRQASSRVA
jgi:hypothetical protein